MSAHAHRVPLPLAVPLALGLALLLLFAALVVVVETSVPRGTTVGDPARDHARYPYGVLERDRIMTQRMGTITGAQTGVGKPMLERARDPRYTTALERHQAELDWMLGRGRPLTPRRP